jgi:hypothetical protein
LAAVIKKYTPQFMHLGCSVQLRLLACKDRQSVFFMLIYTAGGEVEVKLVLVNRLLLTERQLAATKQQSCIHCQCSSCNSLLPASESFTAFSLLRQRSTSNYPLSAYHAVSLAAGLECRFQCAEQAALLLAPPACSEH